MVNSYIVVDLETTGLDPKRDKIIEIGAVRVEAGIPIDRYHTMVNPRRELPQKIIDLTGITQELVEPAPGIELVIEPFLDFCGILPIIGHHVMFDYSFLKRAAVNQGLTLERSGIDTLKLCRQLMPIQEKKTLEAACAWFGIERTCAHRALEDAEDTHKLYQSLSEQFGAGQPGIFVEKPFVYKVKREQMASKKQKEDLRYLLKYHKIDVPVQIDYLTRNEVSRMIDQTISQYGRSR